MGNAMDMPISEFSFDAKSMKEAKDVDKDLLEYLKKLDKERKDGDYDQ